MTDVEKRAAAKQFAEEWQGRGDEKQETQSFWLALLQKVFGVEEPEKSIDFEKRVNVDDLKTGKSTTKFIDGYLPTTRVLIEQKSQDVDLTKSQRQSDDSMLTPFQQGRRYGGYLKDSERPRRIVVCNFREFRIHDMDRPNEEPEIVLLENLEKEYHRLGFLVDTGDEHIKKEMEISLQAGQLVGALYDALLRQYRDPENPETLRSLNALCVRLVFCLYAEDAGIFGGRAMFHDYLQPLPPNGIRRALGELFKILDQKETERDPYLEDDDPALAAFPYVNGGLFSDESIEIPPFTEGIKTILLSRASEDFDWSDISPTIFGAVFESTLNPETRRSGGMHYTSIENIHKVIDPLFLDGLKAELDEILGVAVERTRMKRLRDYQRKLSSLVFLDPACGSGNFLTETYLSLRRLENQVISELQHGQVVFESRDPIQVQISQFYGIEINDFAVTVAKTALWIAESQMMKETEDVVHMALDFLPLKSYANITEGNALRVDWAEIVPNHRLSYIMGNPPFVGQQLRHSAQSEDMAFVFGKGAPETKLDYVLCWYKKAFDLMNTVAPGQIASAFVSTNSICQGESVPTFWKGMFDRGIDIGFAHQSFKWTNESTDIAAVFCVIIGFTHGRYNHEKYLFNSDGGKKAEHINAYLQDAPDIWITSRKNIPPAGMPKMVKGSEPTDGGNLFISAPEVSDYIRQYPAFEKYIKPFVGGDEFISNKQGEYTCFCFWMVKANPADFAHNPDMKERLRAISQKRSESAADRIRKRADYPYLFCQIRQPAQDYLLFPRHSTSDRKYIPLGYMSSDVIVGDACYIIPDAPIYLFGILTSNVHMAWMRLVCGRLGNGYRYSPAIYNNFPYPTPTDEQKAKIECTAQAILDARSLYPDSSLADLYDEIAMPPELRRAHQDNDRAVWEAYGKAWDIKSESACVAHLMKMYQALTEG